MCDARIFAAQTSAFPASAAIDGFGPVASLTDMARRVLAEAPPRMALLGHSMGARVALEVYRLAPDRIDRLALVSAGVHLPRPGEAVQRHALRDLGVAEGAAALVDRWLPPMLAPANRADPAIVDPLRKMCLDIGVGVFAAQSEALLARPEVVTLLPQITCPTMIAVGALDSWSPPDQHAAVAAAVPNATFTVVPGAGHMLPAEDGGAFNAAIAEWLASPTRHRPSTEQRTLE